MKNEEMTSQKCQISLCISVTMTSLKTNKERKKVMSLLSLFS